nr:zinc finger BED domain-containing protein RICESLEEPER 2 [Tanacetum cinerariifolium]
MMKIVMECCLFLVHDIYFYALKVDIGKHLKPLRNDFELDNFLKLAYDNGCKVKLCVEHHGYDVMADGQVEIKVVDEELDDEIEMKDVSKYVGLDHVGTPNSKSKQSTSNAKSPKSPKTPKSKKSTSKKSQSPKTTKSKKSTSNKSQSPKTPIVTPNVDVVQKGCSFRL